MLEYILYVWLPYTAVAVLVVVSIYRFVTNKFSYSSLSSQFLESDELFYGSVPWHTGIDVVNRDRQPILASSEYAQDKGGHDRDGYGRTGPAAVTGISGGLYRSVLSLGLVLVCRYGGTLSVFTFHVSAGSGDGPANAPDVQAPYYRGVPDPFGISVFKARPYGLAAYHIPVAAISARTLELGP